MRDHDFFCTVLFYRSDARAAETPKAGQTVPAPLQTVPDPSQTGSLTVAFTNEEGEPDKFGNKVGLYLVVQTYRVSDSEKALIAPFLVMIPERNPDGTLNYDVKISSAGASDRKAGSESQNTMLSQITPDSKLPNTGGLFFE